MKEFKITDKMREWVRANKDDLFSRDLELQRATAIEFCDEFNTEGQFDTWGQPNWDMYIMYVASIGIWPTVIIDWDIWRDNEDEFLKNIEEMENYIIKLKDKYNRK